MSVLMSKLYFVFSLTALSLAMFGCTAEANNNIKNVQPPAVIHQNPVVQVNNDTQTTDAPSAQALTAKISFEQAIHIAEQHSKGKAVEIEFQHGQTSAIYDVETIENIHEHRVQIDAMTGQVLSSYSEKELNIPPFTKISLLQAINIAQQHIQGQVLQVSLDYDNIIPRYEIKLLAKTGHPYELDINAHTGEVVKSKVEYDGEHDDDD